MFGSILAMKESDVYVSIALSVVVLFYLSYFTIKSLPLHLMKNLLRLQEPSANLYNMLIALLTAVTIVVGMRIMGTMLISSLIIFPALSAMRIFRQFRSVVIASAVISIICFFIGLVASYAFSTPTGASIVIVNLIVFLLCFAAGLIRKKAA